MSVIYHNDYSAIFAIADECAVEVLNVYLPPFWKVTPIPASLISFVPVSKATHPRHSYSSMGLGGAHAQGYLLLANEHGMSGIMSRHSFHQWARIAVRWIKQQFEETGATCKLVSFTPNVIWLVLLS